MIIVNNTIRLPRVRHPGLLQLCNPHRIAQLIESAPLHPLLQPGLSVGLLHRQKHPSSALVNSRAQTLRLDMLRLESQAQGRLLASSRKVLPRICGLGSIQDSRQPTNSHSKSPNGRGLLLSNRGPSPMDRPPSTRARKLSVMGSRLHNVQDSTAVLHHKPNRLQLLQSSNSRRGSQATH
jgi:hypothetical protein